MSGFSMRQLGKTGLQVSPLGIGGGGGIQSKDILYAFDRGINYFFFSSDMHHFAYHNSAKALKMLCGHGSSLREKVVLSTVSYVNHPDKLVGIITDQFSELGIDYVDVFNWGWITDSDVCGPLFRAANQLKGENEITRKFRRFLLIRNTANERADKVEQRRSLQEEQDREGLVKQVNEDLLKRGLVRYVGASFHSRQAARQWMHNIDVVMLRYNLAHTGAERDIVPFLVGKKEQDPGLVVFNVAHENNYFFHLPPLGYPPDEYVPSIPDCYRFALTHPWVDVVLTAPINREQINFALAAVEKGPFSGQECAYLYTYGEMFRAGKMLAVNSRIKWGE